MIRTFSFSFFLLTAINSLKCPSPSSLEREPLEDLGTNIFLYSNRENKSEYLIAKDTSFSGQLLTYKGKNFLRCPNTANTSTDSVLVFTKDNFDYLKECEKNVDANRRYLKINSILPEFKAQKKMFRTPSTEFNSLMNFWLIKDRFPQINHVLKKGSVCASVSNQRLITKEVFVIDFDLLVDYTSLYQLPVSAKFIKKMRKDAWKFLSGNIEQAQFLLNRGYFYSCDELISCPYDFKEKKMYYFHIDKISNIPPSFRGFLSGFLHILDLNDEKMANLALKAEKTLGEAALHLTKFVSSFWYKTEDIFELDGIRRTFDSLKDASFLAFKEPELARKLVREALEDLASQKSFSKIGPARFVQGEFFKENVLKKIRNFANSKQVIKNVTENKVDIVPKIVYIALGLVALLTLVLCFIYFKYQSSLNVVLS